MFIKLQYFYFLTKDKFYRNFNKQFLISSREKESIVNGVDFSPFITFWLH